MTTSQVKALVETDKLFVGGNEVSSTGKIEGTAFNFGRVVKSGADVVGILFSAGENVWITGKNDYLFSAGRMVTVESTILKDAFVAASEVNINKANIGRDLYVGGERVKLSGNFGRNVIVGAENLLIDSGTVIGGELKYNDNAKLEVGSDVKIASKSAYVAEDKSEKRELTGKEMLGQKIKGILFSTAMASVVAILMMVFWPGIFAKLQKNNQKVSGSLFAKRLGVGLGILIILPIVALMAMITVIGVAASILAIVGYLAVLYLSAIFIGYLLGERLPIANKYGKIILGILILSSLKALPYVGGWVVFISLIAGLGLGADLLFSKSKKL